MTKNDKANCLAIDWLEKDKSVCKFKVPIGSIKILKSPGDILAMQATKPNLNKRFALLDKDLADFIENKLG